LANQVPGAQIALSTATLIVSMITALLVLGSATFATRQRESQARREEWWRRFQWAMTLALDYGDPYKRQVGTTAIDALINSPLAGTDELRVAGTVLDAVMVLPDNGQQRQGVQS
jgi:hypothetical protein